MGSTGKTYSAPGLAATAGAGSGPVQGAYLPRGLPAGAGAG